jgi:hypothetical protein
LQAGKAGQVTFHLCPSGSSANCCEVRNAGTATGDAPRKISQAQLISDRNECERRQCGAETTEKLAETLGKFDGPEQEGQHHRLEGSKLRNLSSYPCGMYKGLRVGLPMWLRKRRSQMAARTW